MDHHDSFGMRIHGVFALYFVGAGIEGLRKKKQHFKNMLLIVTGLFMAVLSVIATILLLRGRS